MKKAKQDHNVFVHPSSEVGATLAPFNRSAELRNAAQHWNINCRPYFFTQRRSTGLASWFESHVLLPEAIGFSKEPYASKPASPPAVIALSAETEAIQPSEMSEPTSRNELFHIAEVSTVHLWMWCTACGNEHITGRSLLSVCQARCFIMETTGKTSMKFSTACPHYNIRR
jgi:hypothetical protein